MTGLDSSLGFLHELHPGTTPLVCDFGEPYRWLVDYTMLRMILSRAFSWDDFYYSGPHYELRIDRLLLDRYMDLLRERFNSGVVYDNKRLMWDTLILRKCQEFARYLVGRRGSFDLTSPRPLLERSDTRQLREKILSLSQSEARKLGIGRSALHYLRENARRRDWFRVYGKVWRKLEVSEDHPYDAATLKPSEDRRK
jgi:CRISPR-associated protein Cas1